MSWRGEQEPVGLEIIRQGLVHSPKREPVQNESYIELGSSICAEIVPKTEADVVLIHLVDTSFVPFSRVEGVC